MRGFWGRAANLASVSILACGVARAAEVKPVMHTHRSPHIDASGSMPDALELPNAAAGIAKRYSGTPINVTTYHYDNLRTGWNQSETDLTPASVASAKFGLLKSLTVDGNVFAQPLLVSGYQMPDGSTHDVLIIATGHDSVYAYDAQSYALLWQVSLGTAQKTNDVGCGDVRPEYGISSTPVIVMNGSKAVLYVVAASEPSSMNFSTQLHALDLGTGTDTIAPVEINPSATLSDGSALDFDAQNQWNRASLAYQKGNLYVGIGSHCDNNDSNISGWLLRYNTGLSLTSSFHTIETPADGGLELASIWMTGFAPAIDAKGNVFVVTGNGDYDVAHHARDFGESVLKLPANLASVGGQFTPAAFNSLNGGDTDFGSGGVMLLPAVTGQTVPPLAVAMGKDATQYLLNQTKLGGLHANDSGALQATRIGGSGGGLWGGPAYYNGPSGPTVYSQINGDVLRAYSVTTTGTAALTASITGTSGAGYGGSLPIISSNGGSASTGVLWLIRRGSKVGLEAYDAVALGAPIYSHAAGAWSNVPQDNPFLTPMEANGRVYVPGYKTVKVFGLTP